MTVDSKYSNVNATLCGINAAVSYTLVSKTTSNDVTTCFESTSQPLLAEDSTPLRAEDNTILTSE